MRTLTIPLRFNGVNNAAYNIQGGQLADVKKIHVRQITVANAVASVPPFPAADIKSDLITADQSLGSVCLVPETYYSINLSTVVPSQAPNVTGNHTFTLFHPTDAIPDWSDTNVTVLLTITFT
jgi:hypothetical protein